MKNKLFKSSLAGPIAATLLLAAALPASAAIVLVNTGSNIVTAIKTTTFSYNAGAATKLIVTVASEGAQTGDGVVTYNGVPLTLATGTSAGRAIGTWYLDNPFTGGAANLVVDFTASGTVNGLGVGVASISGAKAGVDVTAAGAGTNPSSISRTVTPTVAGSFVMVNFGANGGGSTAPSALTGIYGFNNIGSSTGYAGYEQNVAATAQTYTFANNVDTPAMGVAVFSPIPEPSSAALLGMLGGLALLRRRR